VSTKVSEEEFAALESRARARKLTLSNGKSVCPSPADKYNFLHPGKTNYRDSNSRCSQHTTVDNKTGQVQSHIDEFNPNDYFLEHVFLDVIPDVIFDITGSYLFPTGNQFCQ
jgi:hypothetical protein